MLTALPVRLGAYSSTPDLSTSRRAWDKSRIPLNDTTTIAHSGQPWGSLSFADLLTLRDRYWALLHDPSLSDRTRHQFDLWCSEIVGELGLRTILRLEAGR